MKLTMTNVDKNDQMKMNRGVCMLKTMWWIVDEDYEGEMRQMVIRSKDNTMKETNTSKADN